MSTYDLPSDLVHRIAYPPVNIKVLKADSPVAGLRTEQEKEFSISSNLQQKKPGDIFYLIESRPRNPWAASGSLIFELLLLAAVIIIPLYHTLPLPKREMLTMLYLSPPPAAGPANATSFRTPTPTYTTPSTGLSAPKLNAQEPPTPPAAVPGGVVGGVPGGVIGGVLGGMLAAMPVSGRSVPLPAKAPEPVKRIRIASQVVEANLIHDVQPQYPPEAGRARIEGTVVLMAVIGTDGSVKDVRVESGLPMLAQAAIDAVKQWRYKPYMVNGQPVEVDSRIMINFTLSS